MKKKYVYQLEHIHTYIHTYIHTHTHTHTHKHTLKYTVRGDGVPKKIQHNTTHYNTQASTWGACNKKKKLFNCKLPDLALDPGQFNPTNTKGTPHHHFNTLTLYLHTHTHTPTNKGAESCLKGPARFYLFIYIHWLSGDFVPVICDKRIVTSIYKYSVCTLLYLFKYC